MSRIGCAVIVLALLAIPLPAAHADTTVFFADCQSSTQTDSGTTSDTISSNGYLFTYTRDKLFTGGTGSPIGRPVAVAWPHGIEAQAVTTPPPGGVSGPAQITIRRVDGALFDLVSFTSRLLANTAATGASLEIMPLLNGEDAFPDPLYFDMSGYYGQSFSYDTSPNPWGSTARLVGFDTYKLTLFVDYALVALTLNSTTPGPQSCCLPGPICSDLVPDACLAQGGRPLGGGTSCSCDVCTLVAPPPPPVPDGSGTTLPLLASRIGASGDVHVTWDSMSCTATNYDLLYGDLATVATYQLGGAACALGTSGSFDWAGAPTGSWFVIVGRDGSATESSWGRDSAGQERNGLAASLMCGATVKDVAASCP